MARLGQFRRDTLANWNNLNPVLADGEFVLVASNPTHPKAYDQWCCGDGISTFSVLPKNLIGDSTSTIDQVARQMISQTQTQVDTLNSFVGNKSYNSSEYSGLARVNLPKNLVNGVNTLTQSMINSSNTIYIIQYDFILGENITIPDDCILEFDGGSISGAYTITGQNTCIEAELVKIFNTNVIFEGNWNIAEAYPEWFGAKGDGVNDDAIAINKSISFIKGGTIYFPNATYTLNTSIVVKLGDINSKITIDLGGSNLIYNGNDWAFIWDSQWAEVGWKTNVKLILKNGNFHGNVDALGAIRLENSVYNIVEDIKVFNFVNGCGFQLYVNKPGNGNGFAWCEENVFRDCACQRTLIGYQTFEDDSIGPNYYRGIDNTRSVTGVSMNHNTWENCNFNGKISNAIGFALNGNFSRSVFIGCGGWLDEDGATGCIMFKLNGWFDSVTFISPYVDAGVGDENVISIGSGYANQPAHFPTIVGASVNYIGKLIGVKDLVNLIGFSFDNNMPNSRCENESGINIFGSGRIVNVDAPKKELHGSLYLNVEAGVLATKYIDFTNKIGVVSEVTKVIITPYCGEIYDGNLSNVGKYGILKFHEYTYEDEHGDTQVLYDEHGNPYLIGVTLGFISGDTRGRTYIYSIEFANSIGAV